jgi:uncharacterized secreted protein with C-terminal beta-propeller domain
MHKKLILLLLSLVFIIGLVQGCTPQPTTVTKTTSITTTPSPPGLKALVANDIVYINGNDNVYHFKGCSLITNNSIPITMNEATSRNYEVCPICIKAEVDKMYRLEKLAKDGDTVYITNSGSKYHREGCRYLSKSSVPISRSEAEARGYEPCSVCKP